MMDKKTENLLLCGIPLYGLGVNNWALTTEQALNAIKIFKKIKVAVIGGDVYSVIEGEIELLYDNWHCEEKRIKETEKDFVLRTLDYAENYILNYNNQNVPQPFFALVCFSHAFFPG
jgi:hypothetical protein